jgi:hypothetical protein
MGHGKISYNGGIIANIMYFVTIINDESDYISTPSFSVYKVYACIKVVNLTCIK